MKQVQATPIATDPNNCREYRDGVADQRADEPTPDEIIDVEAVPIEAVPSEPVPPAPIDTGYTPGGVPTFESVREKIETRYGTSIGAAELASETPEGRSVEEHYDARQRAAAERLEHIRASMHDEPGHT